MHIYICKIMCVQVHVSLVWAIYSHASICICFHVTGISYQHGGEGRLCDKFANSLQTVTSDDVR